MERRGRAGPRRVISIRWIVSGAAVALTAVTVLGSGAFAERNARRALLRELRTRLLLEARNLALASSGALLSEFPELTLTPILSEMLEDEPELAWAVVADLGGVVRGHADPRRIGEEFELPPTLRPARSDALGPGEQVLADARILVASAPVVRRGGERIGTAYVALRRGYVESMIREARRRGLLFVSALLVAGTALALALSSILLRPVGALRAGLERIGRGDLDTPVRLRDRTELGLLAETMNEMATRLKAAQEEHAEKERLAHEVELAREIQSSLLPSGPSHRGRFTVEGSYRAAAEVGGDYWDVLPLAGGRLGVAIADVAGKGLAGCLVTSMLSALLRAFRDSETSPSALLARLERHLEGSLRRGTFITMFYGILDPEREELVFASAGHCPLLVWRAASARAEWYRTQAIPLGAVRGGALARTLHDERIHLAPGDLAVQYTDGINEAFDPAEGEQFGFTRLERAVARAAPSGPAAVVGALRRAVERWAGGRPPLDDETLLVLGRDPEPAALRDPRKDPNAALETARARGFRLRLDARPASLERIHGWVANCPGLETLSQRDTLVLESALYELADNIAEHGLARDPSRPFDVWWVPGPPAAPVRGGYFLFLDDGVPFQPEDGSRVDFRRADVRRRGRGIGLEIIRSAMRLVSYHPGTPAGNVTIMAYDPARRRETEEVEHG